MRGIMLKRELRIMEIKLEKSANHRIAMLAILLKRQIFRIIAKHNLEITPEQWIVMYYLWQEDGLAIGEIAHKSKKDFANVTRIVEKLEKAGYLTKRKNLSDSRSYTVHLLPKSEEIKEPIQQCWQESMNISMDGISCEEQEFLIKIIDKIENNIVNNIDNLQ